MEPARHNGLRIGVAVLALGSALMIDYWLLATNPARWRLRSWAVWTIAALLSVLPELFLGDFSVAIGVPATVIFASACWALLQLGQWMRRAPYRRMAEDARHEDIQKYRPTSFDG